MRTVYNIAELANVHGGDFESIIELVKEFYDCDGVNGIKFQPFHYDRIALPDYKWYPVYKELFFNNEQWSKIISLAYEKTNVWIDVDDDYSTSIIFENLEKIHGIKLQSSILYNEVVFNELKKIDLRKKKIIVNISGIELNEIKKICDRFTDELNPEKLILQIGYQDYPTKLSESGLSKISVLREFFTNPISFADHTDGKTEEAILLPIVTMCLGAEYIEKHVMLKDKQPKYDYFSSITKEQFIKLTSLQKDFLATLTGPFIVNSEKKYLNNSQQIPVAKHELKAGSIISLKHDLEFKRSNSIGLTVPKIRDLTSAMYVTSSDISINSVIPMEKMKKATIAAVIACRLKSSRLKKKAILKIGSISSVEMCIKTTMQLKDVNHVVLATSHLEEDKDLENYTYSPSVIFSKGDPEDVIQRYLDILDQLKADVVIRITADMPYVSQEITEFLLREHFSSGADYTSAVDFAVGTAPQIINVAALHKAKSFFPNADYSEYMTCYFTNNPAHFRINEVVLPPELVRNYRLTLDYEEDLILFNKIEDHLNQNNLPHSTLAIFDYLDNAPEIAKINSHIQLKYKSDEELIRKLNESTTIKS